MKNVAVNGMTLNFSDQSDSTVTGVISPPTASLKVKVNGQGVYHNGDQVIVSAIVTATAPIPDPVPKVASFISSAVKVKADGSLVLLEGDKTATIVAMPMDLGGFPHAVSFKIVVSSAGQIKVKAQ